MFFLFPKVSRELKISSTNCQSIWSPVLLKHSHWTAGRIQCWCVWVGVSVDGGGNWLWITRTHTERKWRISAKENKFIVIKDICSWHSCYFSPVSSNSITSISPTICTPKKVSKTHLLGHSQFSRPLWAVHHGSLLSSPYPFHGHFTWLTSNQCNHPSGMSVNFISSEKAFFTLRNCSPRSLTFPLFHCNFLF